jgi:hypothetical protein
MPLAKHRMGKSCRYHLIDQGLADGASERAPAYVGMSHIFHDSVEAFQNIFGPHHGTRGRPFPLHEYLAGDTDITSNFSRALVVESRIRLFEDRFSLICGSTMVLGNKNRRQHGPRRRIRRPANQSPTDAQAIGQPCCHFTHLRQSGCALTRCHRKRNHEPRSITLRLPLEIHA